MNREIGKKIHVYLVKYHVYQQLKADEHKVWYSRWSTLKMDIEIFSFVFTLTIISTYIGIFSAFVLTHTLMIMWLPMVEIQYDDACVLIDAIKIIY